MFWRRKNIPLVGASQKMEAVARMKAASRTEAVRNFGSENSSGSQAIPVCIVFALSVVLAWMLTDSSVNILSGLHLTGIPHLDSLLTGSAVPNFSGDHDTDHLIIIFIRGFAITLVTGVVPFFSLLATRIFSNTNADTLVICWGTVVFLLILYVSLGNFSGMFHSLGNMFGG